MSVQTQLRDYRSLQSQKYGGSGGGYTFSSARIGLSPKQASNPNPKIIPAPIPSNLVPYRKEDSLKKLQEDDSDDADDNPQYQEFIARRDKQAQIPSSFYSSYTSTTTSNDAPWFLKKPSVRVGDPVLIRSNKGWVKAKIARIKNGRIGIADTMNGGWRYWRRTAPTTILYYDFESPFWKYDGKRLANDPKDLGRQESEKARREAQRNRYSYSYSGYTPPADPPAPEEQPVKLKVRHPEPIFYQSPDTGRYIYGNPSAYVREKLPRYKEKPEPQEPVKSHVSHKRHSFFKDRKRQDDAGTDDGTADKGVAEAKLQRDRKRGELIEQRIFCHLDKKQLDEYKQGKLKLNDLPALRPLLFDIEVDLDTQNIVYPDDNDDEYEVNEVIVDGPVDEQHLTELNKAFFQQFGSESDENNNGIVYADDGHANERDDELSRFDIRGSQCSYSMDVPSLSSSCSTELDPDALHIRPVNDFSLDSYHAGASQYDYYSNFHVKQYNEELTLEAFNIVLGDPETEARAKLDQVQTIKPEAHDYDVAAPKKYIDDEEYKPVVETHKTVKTMELQLDYFIDILDTRTGQIRCEMGPKLVDICGYEDIVKGPERLY